MDLEKYLTDNNNVDTLKIQNLDEETLNKIKKVAETVSVGDSNSIIQYGSSIQNDLANFSDTILQEVKSKDSGYVGEIMSDLMIKVKDLDAGGLMTNGNKGILSKIFNPLENSVKKFMAKYQKVSLHLETIIEKLEKSKMQLMRDVIMLEKVYEKNLEYLKNLNLFILAGNMKLEEMNNITLPQLQEELKNNENPVLSQKMNDLTQFINRFEKRIHDLKLSRTISIQTAPQIRLIQNNNNLLIEKIQSSLMNVIPLWKNQIVIAISIFRQKTALEMQKEVTKTTNDLLKKNSELLKQSTIETAKESEKGIVEIETLKKVNDDLISTIDEVLNIQKEGRIARLKAEEELLIIEKQLKERLTKTKGD